jgi:hypothetical protein
MLAPIPSARASTIASVVLPGSVAERELQGEGLAGSWGCRIELRKPRSFVHYYHAAG